jgi:hypothetical protein
LSLYRGCHEASQVRKKSSPGVALSHEILVDSD